MAKNTIADLDTTAANNTDVLNQSTQGTAAVSTIDTMIQNALGLLARFYYDLGGKGTVGGTADAITLTTGSTYQALETGLFLAIKPTASITGASTLNVDGLGAKAIRRMGDSATQAGDMVDDGVYLLRYDETYNTAAGAWVLLNPTVTSASFATNTQAVTGTSTVLNVNPNNLSAVRQRRNRIPNPANQISSVNGNTAGTTNGYSPADGVNVYRVTSAGTITVQRVQSVTPKGSRDRVRITNTAADASLAADEYLTHTRNLTGNENADLQWGTASAKQIVDRFLFKGPAGTYAVSYKNYNSGTPNRSYVALFTPAAANTDEVITIVVPGDTSGTWETGTNPAIVRDIVLACGSTFQGTTGWQAGNILGTSAVSNGMATINDVFEIAEEGLYLDPESTGVPPAWELPSYRGDQLAIGTGFDLVRSIEASASSTINFDSSTGVTFAADYDYIIKCTNVKNSADGQLQLQFGTGGTPTYQTTTYTTIVATANSTAFGVATNSITSAVLVSPATMGGASAGENYSSEIIIDEPAANDYHAVTTKGTSLANDGTMQLFQTGGRRTAQEVVTGIRLQPSTGNIASGTFTLYRRMIR